MADNDCTSFSRNQKRTEKEDTIGSCSACPWWAPSDDDRNASVYRNSTITNGSSHHVLSWHGLC